MKLSDRLTRMIDGMPHGAMISLPVDTVREWLNDNGSGLDSDFTVEEVGKFFDRSPVTIRTWIRDGQARRRITSGTRSIGLRTQRWRNFRLRSATGNSHDHSNSAHDRG